MGSPPARTHNQIHWMVVKVRKLGLEDRLRSVCLAYHVELEDVFSRKRFGRIVRARDACIVKLLAMPMSGPEVGVIMGMDHSSVFAARDRYKERDNGRLQG